MGPAAPEKAAVLGQVTLEGEVALDVVERPAAVAA